jgi:MobA/MobL family
MAIFHLSIRPISRAKDHSAVAQIAYDTRSKLTNERTGERHDWSKHIADVVDWQIIGPMMQPGELAARTEVAEKRWDARVGRAMDVAVPHELSTKAQWELVRGFGLQLRDTYGVALCVSLHRPNAKGDDRNFHGHIFMTTRAVDADGNFSKSKIREFDDRKLGPEQIERIREMWEVRCNRALRKAGVSDTVNRKSLEAQGVDRPATKHLGPKATAMTRNGCRMRKAEINELISSDCSRLTEVNAQLIHLKTHDRKTRRQIRKPIENLDLAAIRQQHQIKSERPTDRVVVFEESSAAHNGNRPARNPARTRSARPHAGRELARLLAGGASIGGIAQGHHFRGGQLLVGVLRTLRVVIRILEIEQRRQQYQRDGVRMKS